MNCLTPVLGPRQIRTKQNPSFRANADGHRQMANKIVGSSEQHHKTQRSRMWCLFFLPMCSSLLRRRCFGLPTTLPGPLRSTARQSPIHSNADLGRPETTTMRQTKRTQTGKKKLHVTTAKPAKTSKNRQKRAKTGKNDQKTAKTKTHQNAQFVRSVFARLRGCYGLLAHCHHARQGKLDA